MRIQDHRQPPSAAPTPTKQQIADQPSSAHQKLAACIHTRVGTFRCTPTTPPGAPHLTACPPHRATRPDCSPALPLPVGPSQLLPLLDAIPPVRVRVGRPRRKPDSLFADRGYDTDIYYCDQVRARGVVPASARRGTLHGTGLGTYRWVVERSFA